jgi:wobble nucleotide-excising tRNase
MLREIQISDEASYGTAEHAQKLGGLKEINFIFGTNGSGKTTISRVIANPESCAACSLAWDDHREIERLVYNSDFVTKNFKSQMDGIFTLGEAEGEALKKIEEARSKIGEIEKEIQSLEVAESGQRGALDALRTSAEAKFWVSKTKHDAEFREAFSGHRSSRAAFFVKVLREAESNTASLIPMDQLQARAATVFKNDLAVEELLAVPSGGDFLALEGSAILQKKIVGRDDIDVAALIQSLGSSDWVRQGLSYLTDSPSVCPFCQQDVDEHLAHRLGEYFDETYLGDVAAVEKLRQDYELQATAICDELDELATSGNPFLDPGVLGQKIEVFRAKIAINKSRLDQKRSEPSAPVELEGLGDTLAEIVALAEEANGATDGYNSIVENQASERTTLISEIWKALCTELSDSIDEYLKGAENVDKALASISAKIKAKDLALGELKKAITALEKSITSVQPTVDAINAILGSFGFTNFKLETTGASKNLYAIIRLDGQNAAATLSEGERSFISFLYFYHLLKGSHASSGISVDRIVVFDDPVSSLDSDVLFIVSSLIKGVLEEACGRQGLIKQVFLFTHNIYFHKEVSFDVKRQNVCRAHETFWIVRKIDGRSVVAGYDYNPIRTSYELLWDEVRNPKRSRMTIQNTLRRILENYFKILGNVDKANIINKFSGKDKQICASLFAWVNEGSHGFNDDLYISADEGVVDKYLEVFRRVFGVTNHMAHYEMMIGPEALDVETEAHDFAAQAIEEAVQATVAATELPEGSVPSDQTQNSEPGGPSKGA